jgi:hypothetical protein
MSNSPGAQAQANTHASRNSPSDIDELRDNAAAVAGSVGDMASHQYERAYEVATDAVLGQKHRALRNFSRPVIVPPRTLIFRGRQKEHVWGLLTGGVHA